MIGVIGGTGLNHFDGVQITEQKWFETPFGEPSAPLTFAQMNGQDFIFMPRHGKPHKYAPHLINYRANLSAFKQAGVDNIVAVNAVGGIHPNLGPTCIAIPDQIIDYTHGRAATIYDGCHLEGVEHIDFSHPYAESIRQKLLTSAVKENIKVLAQGTYGATQGPRLETAAEIKRLQRDGCDMVGMTGMPEAALARELGLNYACVALSVNWAAGITEQVITMKDIEDAVEQGMGEIQTLLKAVILS